VAAIPCTLTWLGRESATSVSASDEIESDVREAAEAAPAPFGTEAQILAYGLAFPVALSLGRMTVGLFYLRDLRALRA
jgi:hypothetical protein